MSNNNSGEIGRRETGAFEAQAKVISEALPYMRRHTGQTIVIKYGGHAMGDLEMARIFARDIVLLRQCGAYPVVVHGGGPQIGNMLKKLDIESQFIDGLRVTDAATVGVAEMVLCGAINKEIVSHINNAGGFAVGISGKDGNLIKCERLRRTQRDPESNIEKAVDLGLVGQPSILDTTVLDAFHEAQITPVIAPIGAGPEGETLNVNADTAAGAVAGASRAKRLFMLTDVPGVLDKNKRLITEMTVSQAKERLSDGVITGGMIPKVETCLDAVAAGCEGAAILDGTRPHGILVELFTAGGAGTLIVPD